MFSLSSRINNDQMVHACWWYYFSKFTEFFDTVSTNDHRELTLTPIRTSVFNIYISFLLKLTPWRSSSWCVRRRVKCPHFMSSITVLCQCRVSYFVTISLDMYLNLFSPRQSGSELSLHLEVTLHSSVCWTQPYTLWCIHTICSQRWVHNIRNTCGGKNILRVFRWWVIGRRLIYDKRWSTFSLVLGSICSHLCPRFPASWAPRLRLSQSFCVVDRNARCYVLLSVQRVLPPIVWWQKGKPDVPNAFIGTKILFRYCTHKSRP